MCLRRLPNVYGEVSVMKCKTSHIITLENMIESETIRKEYFVKSSHLKVKRKDITLRTNDVLFSIFFFFFFKLDIACLNTRQHFLNVKKGI